MEEYYILKEGDKDGPFSVEELSKSHLFHSTMLWKKGEEKWRPASHFEELRGLYTPDLPRHKSNHLTTTTLVFVLVSTLLLLLAATFAFLFYREVNKPPEEPQKTIQDYQLEKEEKEKKEKLLLERENERLEKEKKEREEKEKMAIEKRKNDTRLRIDSLITIEYGGIESKFWGGVRPFDITVKNKTDYFIDEILVNITYHTNGRERSKDVISFQNLRPGDRRTQPTKGSNVGLDARCVIHRIISEELKLNAAFGNE